MKMSTEIIQEFTNRIQRVSEERLQAAADEAVNVFMDTMVNTGIAHLPEVITPATLDHVVNNALIALVAIMPDTMNLEPT